MRIRSIDVRVLKVPLEHAYRAGGREAGHLGKRLRETRYLDAGLFAARRVDAGRGLRLSAEALPPQRRGHLLLPLQ